MQTVILSCVLLFVFCGSVSAQDDLLQDPGFTTLPLLKCGDSVWKFRSDYRWNDTDQFFDSRCSVFLELPTEAQPGLTRGNQTNINKFILPDLPETSGGDTEYPSSAAVVDFNSPCRASLWQSFSVPDSAGATFTLSLQLWARSDPSISQVLLADSDVPNSPLLEYLRSPDGALQISTGFPVIREETNQIRIDFIIPDAEGSFFDRAFSVDPDHIAVQVPIPGFEDGEVTPDLGTEREWILVEMDVTTELQDFLGQDLALRVASATSQVGVSWGVGDVHLMTEGGLKRRAVEMKEESAKVEVQGRSVRHVRGKPLRRK